MGSATIRRFALVAAMVLLAPLSFRPSVVVRAVQVPGTIVAGLPSDGSPASPAIRRHTAGAWAMAGTRVDQARRLLGLGVVALLSLLVIGPWSILESRRSAPSPLVRRRHAIALRAPPLPSCA
jgi:hypothetical protein